MLLLLLFKLYSKALQDSFQVAAEHREGRKFGTHTGRKTFIVNCLLAGQMIFSPDKKQIWSEVNLDDLGKTARMKEGTLKHSYICKLFATFLESRTKDVTFLQLITARMSII